MSVLQLWGCVPRVPQGLSPAPTHPSIAVGTASNEPGLGSIRSVRPGAKEPEVAAAQPDVHL